MSEPPTEPVDQATAYYRAIDEDDYTLLSSLLAAEFVHDRPDRTIEGREQFVQFMRDERPQTDTTHPVDSIYQQQDGHGIAVRGRLLTADGDPITGFVDVFEFGAGRIQRLNTYVD